MELAFDLRTVFQPAQIIQGKTQIFSTSEGFGYLATDILLVLTTTAGALAFILIVVAGIRFVTSGGDPKKLASATSTLTYAIIGLAVTFLAFIILRIVEFFLTAPVTPVG